MRNGLVRNGLVLSGLRGIRPWFDDVPQIDPVLPQGESVEAPVRYFALRKLRCHATI